MKLRLPKSAYNTISYAGAAIAIIATCMFVFLYVLDSISSSEIAYAGIFIFLVIPVFIILGLVLIPIGMLRKIRTDKKAGKGEATDLPVLDLNQPRHRTGAIIFASGTAIFMFLSALGSYKGYHYTESVDFCGKICHEVMHPEYIAYNKSPHARVTCAECHVGEGANWYVKSKLSGLYQVYAAVANVYPQPIPTPIENLRPARETCERCHWPQKTYGKQQRRTIYVLSDKENTKWQLDLLMNTGGGNPALGNNSGIHWHINPDIEIEYVTTDERRLVIPRVTLRNKKTGEEIIYEDEYDPFDPETAEHSETRVMDCMDCHNRPSHNYDDPSRFINTAIAANVIPSTLPYIKKVAVEACMQEFETNEEALQGIEEYMTAFYRENYGDDLAQSEDLKKAIQGTKEAFSQNIFPDMNVSWEQYPNHIGHMNSPGCFRCHDGKHTSEDGQTISHECENCHMIMAQGREGQVELMETMGGLPFQHPVNIDEAWKEMPCYECHSVPPIDF